MMLEVIVGVVAVRAAVPPVRTPMAMPPLRRTPSSGSTLTRSTTTEAGQRLRDGFGGIRLGGVCGFGGHVLILHAT